MKYEVLSIKYYFTQYDSNYQKHKLSLYTLYNRRKCKPLHYTSRNHQDSN